MLTQVVGESITFSKKQGASLLYNGGTIAVVVKGNMDSSYIDSFKDRIQWDQQTGQFTIRELKTSDSGIYVVDGKGGVKTTYQLTVYDPVSRPMLTTLFNGSCSVECSVMNDRDVTLSWYSGEKILNQTSSPELSIKLSLPLEVDKQDRTSYRCEAANPVTKENVMFYVPESCMVTNMTGINNKRAYLSLIAIMCVLVASVVVGLAICQKKGRNVHFQDPSEGEQPDIEYAEISYIIPTSIQEKQIDISEVDLPRETEVTVYEKLQLHRMADSDDEGKVKQRSRQMI
uniref:Ig-like domain-containing protein n=1 Tax=Esox lucius TaxID=8010 RepID=A0AAY5KTX5_ESOLU